MIEAVIFDFGGVIKKTTDHSYRRQWEEKLNLGDRGSEEVVFNSDVGIQAQLGDLTSEAMWQWVSKHLGLSADDGSQFRRDFWAGDEIDKDLVGLIRRLRPTYQIALLSNADESLRADLTDRYQIADLFDLIVVSAEVKMMKPNPDIYRLVIQRLGRKPSECLFIDDFIENVEAARLQGMKAIHYTPDVDLTNELSAMGLSIGD